MQKLSGSGNTSSFGISCSIFDILFLLQSGSNLLPMAAKQLRNENSGARLPAFITLAEAGGHKTI
jgi:hypothetical protein